MVTSVKLESDVQILPFLSTSHNMDTSVRGKLTQPSEPSPLTSNIL